MFSVQINIFTFSSLINHCQDYIEFDSFIAGVLPSNPWITEDTTLWALNNRE